MLLRANPADREKIAKVVHNLDNYDPDERDALMAILKLEVTDPRPEPTIRSLLRERICEFFVFLWAATIGPIWGHMQNFVFYTAIGMAMSKIVLVVAAHVLVWGAWSLLIGPVPRTALYFVYSSILTICVYAWLFHHQLPIAPVRYDKRPSPWLAAEPVMHSFQTSGEPPSVGCRCKEGHCKEAGVFPGECLRPVATWGVKKTDSAPVKNSPAPASVKNSPAPVKTIGEFKVVDRAKAPVKNSPAPVKTIGEFKAVDRAKASVKKSPAPVKAVATKARAVDTAAYSPVQSSRMEPPVASNEMDRARSEIRGLIKQNEGLRELLKLNTPGELYRDYAMEADSSPWL